ncbi:unnamed protein product, partial [Durusdinium trenchii]
MAFVFVLGCLTLAAAECGGSCQEIAEHEEVLEMNTELLQVKVELSKNQLDLADTAERGLRAAAATTGGNCESWCQYEGTAAWQYDPNCNGCTSSLIQQFAAQVPGVCATWCKYEGPATWQYDPNCGGCTEAKIANMTSANGPVCMSYCQYVGTAVWQYDPDCQGCTQVRLTQDSKGECKDYCQYEPTNADCRGCQASLMQQHTAQVPGVCATWCKYEGPATWQYDPNCGGCTEAKIANMTSA